MSTAEGDNASSQSGQTQTQAARLFRAVAAGDLNLVRQLLEAGVDPDGERQRGKTALCQAAEWNNCECVRLLIQANASVNGYPPEDDSPILWTTPLVSAVERGSLDCVKLRLEAGASINSPFPGVDSVVVIAGWRGSLECVEFLLESGAGVNAPVDPEGDSPFFRLMSGLTLSMSIVQAFLKAGVDVTARNNAGETSLQQAINYGLPDYEGSHPYARFVAIARLMFAAGENVDGVTTDKYYLTGEDDDSAEDQVEISEYFGPKEEMTLKNLCRTKVRSLLMGHGPGNLFLKVPLLRLEEDSLKEFLLYDESVDEEYEIGKTPRNFAYRFW